VNFWFLGRSRPNGQEKKRDVTDLNIPRFYLKGSNSIIKYALALFNVSMDAKQNTQMAWTFLDCKDRLYTLSP